MTGDNQSFRALCSITHGTSLTVRPHLRQHSNRTPKRLCPRLTCKTVIESSGRFLFASFAFLQQVIKDPLRDSFTVGIFETSVFSGGENLKDRMGDGRGTCTRPA